MRRTRKHHTFIDTLKGPVSVSKPKEVRPTTVAKWNAISQWLVDHNWEVDYSDMDVTYFLKGSKQINLFTPPEW